MDSHNSVHRMVGMAGEDQAEGGVCGLTRCGRAVLRADPPNINLMSRLEVLLLSFFKFLMF